MPLDKLSPDETTGLDKLKTANAHDTNLPGNFLPTEETTNRGCECAPEIKIGSCSAGSRIRHNGRAKKRPVLRTSTRLIQFVLSGVIGLAAGGFILFLANPDHPLILSIRQLFHGKEAIEKEVDQSQSKVDTPVPSENAFSPLASANPSTTTPPETETTTPKPVSIDEPSESADPAKTPQVVPQPNEADQNSEKIVDPKPAMPSEDHKTIVLDFSKPRVPVVLSSAKSNDDVAIKIVNVVGLNTPYELKPKLTPIDRKNPVDIIFPEHDAARIHVSLHSQNGKPIIKLDPEVLLTSNNWVPFTKNRLVKLIRMWQKKKQNADLDLADGNNQVKELTNRLKKATPQESQLIRKRLDHLKDNVIPELEKQVKFVEQRIATLQQLSQLREQINGKAEIHYTVYPSSP